MPFFSPFVWGPSKSRRCFYVETYQTVSSKSKRDPGQIINTLATKRHKMHREIRQPQIQKCAKRRLTMMRWLASGFRAKMICFFEDDDYVRQVQNRKPRWLAVLR